MRCSRRKSVRCAFLLVLDSAYKPSRGSLALPALACTTREFLRDFASIDHSKEFVRRQRSTQEYAKLTYAQTDQAANLTFKNE